MSRPSHARWVLLRLALLAIDLLALCSGLVLAAVARYDGAIERINGRYLLFAAAVAVLVFLVTSFTLRLHQGRYAVASADELTGLALALAAAAVVGCALILNAGEDRPLPLSVPLVAAVLAFVLMLGVRLVIRWQRSGALRPRQGRRTLVFGAGNAGHQLIRSMLGDPESPYLPVGLLDDDPDKRHVRRLGVPMLGDRRTIQAAAGRTGAEVLVIALPSADAALIRDISRRAREAGLTVKVLPSLSELLSTKVGIRDVRDIDIADILGRRQVETDVGEIAGYLRGKRLLVTGAGGSIGSELCRQLVAYEPAEVIMLDRDESALHAVQLSIHGEARLDLPEVVLADIREPETIREVFRRRRPEVVFHAAALKHLNMLEQYPLEAWKTNVMGTDNVLRAAAEVGVDCFVNVSTDKAADPVCVLGQTKRFAERLTASYALENPGRFLSVRFGNVLGSRGSVLETFAAQIAGGRPVTVTHPDVTRYFMTIPEAVQLVIQAGAIGRGGEVLVLDMGAPVRIADVAAALIDLADRPINILFTGLRAGEKLHESLFGTGELDVRPVHPLISHVPVPPLTPEEVRRPEHVPAFDSAPPAHRNGRMVSR
ncbi:polysaccharide biosynthesis protein [Geodermatophilus sp. SYSU D00691]